MELKEPWITLKKKFDILILEPKSIHWTSVEPYFKNLDKRIALFAPEKSIEYSLNVNPKIYFLHANRSLTD